MTPDIFRAGPHAMGGEELADLVWLERRVKMA
jgi:hypothetical protein